MTMLEITYEHNPKPFPRTHSTGPLNVGLHDGGPEHDLLEMQESKNLLAVNLPAKENVLRLGLGYVQNVFNVESIWWILLLMLF